MAFYTRFKILAGEEVTVDYGHKRAYLKRIYGFECSCGGCTDDSASDGMGSETSRSEDMEREREASRIDELVSKALDRGILG
jgi:hypothetical protein